MATVVHDTIPRQFLASVEAYHRPDAFRHKVGGSYRDISHGEVYARVSALACALGSLTIARRDRVALLSENRIEWAIADLAILARGAVNVPLYATLPANQIEYMLRDSQARAIFVSSRAQLAKIASIRGRLPALEHVIVFDSDASTDGVLTLEFGVLRRETRVQLFDFITELAEFADCCPVGRCLGGERGLLLLERRTVVRQFLEALL